LVEEKRLAAEQSPLDYVHRDDKLTAGRRPRYEAYLSPELMAEGIDNGTLYQGILRINRRNRSDSYVTSDDLEYDIYINGSRDRNRALEGDMVAVRLLNVDTVWKRKKHNDTQNKQPSDNGNNKKEAQIGDGATEIETDDEDNVDKNKPKLCGQVVGVLHRMEGQQITG
jgi:protein SSD1